MKKKTKTKKQKRDHIRLFGYDESSVLIPIPKNSYWWNKRHKARCVVGCINSPTVAYVSDYGLATLAYCKEHASIRIMKDLLNGTKTRGIFVICHKGKLIPFWEYDVLIKKILEITDAKIRKILEIQKKLNDFKKRGKIVVRK